jgi:hypothetical protein
MRHTFLYYLLLVLAAGKDEILENVWRLVNESDKGKSTLLADFVKTNDIFHHAKVSTGDGLEFRAR